MIRKEKRMYKAENDPLNPNNISQEKYKEFNELLLQLSDYADSIGLDMSFEEQTGLIYETYITTKEFNVLMELQSILKKK